MERRVLLAVVLSFLVLFGYQALVVKPKPKPAGADRDTTTSAPAAAPVEAPVAAAGTDRPAAGGPRRRDRRAADRARDVARQGDVLEPRRHPRELAAQGLPRFEGPADGHGRAGADHAGSPSAVDDGRRRGAERPPEHRALPGVDRRSAARTPAPARLQFTYRDASGVSVVKTIDDPAGWPAVPAARQHRGRWSTASRSA